MDVLFRWCQQLDIAVLKLDQNKNKKGINRVQVVEFKQVPRL